MRYWSSLRSLAAGAAAATAIFVLAACAGPATGSSTSQPPAEHVVQCESGVVTDGDVEISSAVAERVAVDAPLEPGCHVIE